jgi:hypothetical protein
MDDQIFMCRTNSDEKKIHFFFKVEKKRSHSHAKGLIKIKVGFSSFSGSLYVKISLAIVGRVNTFIILHSKEFKIAFKIRNS